MILVKMYLALWFRFVEEGVVFLLKGGDFSFLGVEVVDYS